MFNYNDYYKELAPIYNTVRLDALPDIDMSINLIVEYLPEKKSEILDIGCGTGKYGELLTALGNTVLGIDKSKEQIDEAKKVINAVVGDATNLPFNPESFDACIMIMMIHQLSKEERRKAFDEVNKVLKPNGVLIIKTASHEDIKKRITSIFFPDVLEYDFKRYPDTMVLKLELGSLFDVTIIPKHVTTKRYSEELLYSFTKRRTSNLGHLSQEQLSSGLNRFSKEYPKNCLIQKESYYTFFVCTKKRVV